MRDDEWTTFRLGNHVRLVDHIFRNLKFTDAVGVLDLPGGVGVPCRVARVIRVADGDKLDFERIVITAKHVGLSDGRVKDR